MMRIRKGKFVDLVRVPLHKILLGRHSDENILE